jgi:hypothetical protein
MSSDAVTPQPAEGPRDLPPDPAVQAPPRFDTQPFRPDGGVPLTGLLWTLSLAVGSGVAIGAGAAYVAQWLYLVLVFPAAMGLVVGAATARAVRQGKVRSPHIAALAGVLGGAAVVLSLHYFEYLNALDDMDAKNPGAKQAALDNGFTLLHFFEVRAREGVSLAQTGHSSEVNLGYFGSYVYWLVDAGMVLGVAWIFPRLAARKPFCARCSHWKSEHALAVLDPAWQRTVFEAVRQGELLRLLEGAGHRGTEHLSLKLSSCDFCGEDSPADVLVESVSKNSKGHPVTAELAHVTYPGEVLRHLGRTAGA